MKNYFTEEKDFEKIKVGDYIEIFIKKADKPVNGNVVENNFKQSYMRISDNSIDTMVRYEQIASVRIFEFIELDLVEYNKEREKIGLSKIEIIPTSSEEIENLNNFCRSINHEGSNFSDLGKYHEAIEKYNLVLAVNPKYMPALYNMGLALFNLDKFREAKEMFDRVLEIDPKYINALSNNLVILGNLDRQQEILDISDKILKINPKHLRALNSKGFAMFRLGKYQEALEFLDAALKIDPEYLLSVNNKKLVLCVKKAESLISSNANQEALEILNYILKIDPENTYAVSNKGYVLNQLCKFQEAIEVFDKLIKNDSENILALISKGHSLNGLGKYQEALRFFDKVLEIDPRNTLVLDSREFALNKLDPMRPLEIFKKYLPNEITELKAIERKEDFLNELNKDNDKK